MKRTFEETHTMYEVQSIPPSKPCIDGKVAKEKLEKLCEAIDKVCAKLLNDLI